MNAPPDQADRDRIRTSLDGPLFVGAGAGTGKTTALVARILERVARGGSLARIVAISFTEKAAAELKARIRARLDERLAGAKGGADGEAEAETWERALEELESAQVTTIHGFAASLLREFPIEAGVDPGFRTAEAVESEILREETLRRWMARTLSAPDGAPLLEAIRLEIPLGALEQFAREAVTRRSLFADTPFPVPARPDAARTRDGILYAAEELDRTLPQKDRAAFGPVLSWAGNFAGRAGDDLVEALVLSDPPYGGLNYRKADPPARRAACDLVRKMMLDHLSPYREAYADHLVAAVAAATIDPGRGVLAAYDAAKRARGILDFDDLLRLGARLLERSDVRETLADRWDEILIDEFQDTDARQARMAERLAPLGGGGAARVLVGDPQQSIYRFRGADLSVFRASRDAFARDAPGRAARLATNFRAVGEIVTWTNEVFGRIFGPAFEPILSAPDAPSRAGEKPAVRFLRCAPPDEGEDSIDAFRMREAEAVAATLHRMKEEGEPILDRGSAVARPFAWGDAALLFPAFTKLPIYQRALEEAGIPYRVQGGKGFYASEEVHALVQVLRAVSRPGDDVARVAALRSTAFGLSDPDLLALQRGAVPEEAAAALDVIEDLRAHADSLPAAALAARAVERTALGRLAAVAECSDQAASNLEKALAILRAFEAAGEGSLVRAADYLAERSDEGAEEIEAAAADDRDPVVRILTIHKAKGLEFGAVFLCGLSDRDPAGERTFLRDRADGRIEVGLGKRWNFYGEAKRGVAKLYAAERDGAAYARHVATKGFLSLLMNQEDPERSEERNRLAYVAATRARNIFVFPLAPNKVFSEIFAPGAESYVFDAPPPPPPAPPPPLRSRDELAAARAALEADLAAARKRLAEGTGRTFLAPSAEDVFEPETGGTDRAEDASFRRARSAKAVLGTAVHAVLARASVRAILEDRIPPALAELCAAEQGLADGAEVLRLARAARTDEILALLGAAVRVRREIPFRSLEGDALVEGVIDCLIETPDRAVVVDWKTDETPREEIYRERMERYAAAASRGLGGRPVETRLVFLAR